ncbi:MAG: polymerase sigma factor [Eubacteriales bacterium]|nr:polymerase sigma factor [Eubacteriales bacterium]MDN5364191.1 polymerase sigma factor [Eubacteriales bacterium]
MFFIFFNSLGPDIRKDDDRELWQKARQGDEEARNRLLEKYLPFIMRIAAGIKGEYVHSDMDEVSIGLIAFNEAIDSYEEGKGLSFLSFAEMVVKRRLIDYYRREKKENLSLPLSYFQDETDAKSEEAATYYIEREKAAEEFQRRLEEEERREEIIKLSRELTAFGITFQDLVEVAPKHRDARLSCLEIARVIVRDKELLDYVQRRKELPLKALTARVAVSRKTLERQRKYLVALVVILSGDYPCLQEYLKGERG